MLGQVLPSAEAGFPAVELAAGSGRLRARFLPSLNMLCSSLAHDGEELLFLRGGVADYAERGKTCGIPLLHPWANRLAGDRYVVGGREVRLSGPGLRRDANGLANHGLLSGPTKWTIEGERCDEDTAELWAGFSFRDPQLLESFPFPHEIAMRVQVEDTSMTVTTKVWSLSPRAVPIAFGQHPYLRLPGIPRERWMIHLPVERRVRVDERLLPTGHVDPVRIPDGPLGDRVFDDGFTDIADGTVFAIEGGSRRIEVEFVQGYPCAQVWAPQGSEFLCIEPMTARTNALADGRESYATAREGQPYEAVFTIRVRDR